MMEVIARSDGRFAVCESEGSAVDPVVAIFPTAAEADEWMLQRALRVDSREDGLGVLLPGGGQGLRDADIIG